jgi:hypothetical protein
MRAFHAGCYPAHAARQPWYRRPSWPVNRWRSLLPFNALLLGLVLGLHLLVTPIAPQRWLGLGLLLLLVNGWLMAARLISYLTIERHLPPSATSR